jgi:hypothetical protein
VHVARGRKLDEAVHIPNMATDEVQGRYQQLIQDENLDGRAVERQPGRFSLQ